MKPTTWTLPPGRTWLLRGWNFHGTHAGWWFGTFVIFPYIGNKHPNRLLFFRGVENTNQHGFYANHNGDFRETTWFKEQTRGFSHDSAISIECTAKNNDWVPYWDDTEIPKCDQCWLMVWNIKITIKSIWIPIKSPLTIVNYSWLVVWNINFIFHTIWDVILLIDELHHFSRWERNHQPEYMVSQLVYRDPILERIWYDLSMVWLENQKRTEYFFLQCGIETLGTVQLKANRGKMMMKHGMSAGVPECPSENRQTHMEISLGCEDECYFSWTGLMCLWPMATLPSLPPCVPELVGAAMYARPLPRPLYWWWKPGFLYMYICIYIIIYIYMYIYIYILSLTLSKFLPLIAKFSWFAP